MKKQLLIFAGAAFFASCGDYTENNAKELNSDTTVVEIADTTSALEMNDTSTVMFGEEVQAEGAIDLTQFAQQIEGKDSVEAKIVAVPSKVCQKMGCWFIVELPNGEEMRIKTKDHAFTVPKDMAGKEVVFEGLAYRDTVSVAQLQHFAEDAGKSKEEIAAITEAEESISFRADGVRIL